MSRFTRQIRLAEVGEAGQAKLALAKVRLANSEGTAARGIEERYLRAAGVGVASSDAVMVPAPREASSTRTPTLTGLPAAAFSPDLGIRHASAQAVADGAFAALVAMRAALGVAE